MTKYPVKKSSLGCFDCAPEAVGKEVMLVTPDEFDKLPDGTVLYSIFGEKRVKGKNHIDDDTRGGHLAYGYLLP